MQAESGEDVALPTKLFKSAVSFAIPPPAPHCNEIGMPCSCSLHCIYAWICAHVLLWLKCANIAVPLPTVQQRVCHMCTPPPKPLSALAAVQWL